MIDFSPPQGESRTVVERLVAYLAPQASEVSGRMAGAPEDLIALYARLAGFAGPEALPVAYTAFLRAAGLDDGGLLENDFQVSARLPEVIEIYQAAQAASLESISDRELRGLPTILPELPVVAVSTDILGWERTLSLDRRTIVAEPEILETSDGEVRSGSSASWEHLLTQAAILQVEPRRLASGRWCSSSIESASAVLPMEADGEQSVAAAVDRLIAALALPVAWPSDPRHRIAIGQDLSLFAGVRAGNTTMLYAFSSNPSELQRLAEQAARTLGTRAGGELRLIDGVLK